MPSVTAGGEGGGGGGGGVGDEEGACYKSASFGLASEGVRRFCAQHRDKDKHVYLHDLHSKVHPRKGKSLDGGGGDVGSSKKATREGKSPTRRVVKRRYVKPSM